MGSDPDVLSMLQLVREAIASHPLSPSPDEIRFFRAARAIATAERIPDSVPPDPHLAPHLKGRTTKQMISGILFDAGKFLIEKERELEAIPILIRVIQIDIEDADAHSELAVAYRNIRDYEKAIIHYRARTLLRPNDAWVYCGLADCHMFIAQIDEGLALYRRARELNPNHPSVRDRWSKLREMGIG